MSVKLPTDIFKYVDLFESKDHTMEMFECLALSFETFEDTPNFNHLAYKTLIASLLYDTKQYFGISLNLLMVIPKYDVPTTTKGIIKPLTIFKRFFEDFDMPRSYPNYTKFVSFYKNITPSDKYNSLENLFVTMIKSTRMQAFFSVSDKTKGRLVEISDEVSLIEVSDTACDMLRREITNSLRYKDKTGDLTMSVYMREIVRRPSIEAFESQYFWLVKTKYPGTKIRAACKNPHFVFHFIARSDRMTGTIYDKYGLLPIPTVAEGSGNIGTLDEINIDNIAIYLKLLGFGVVKASDLKTMDNWQAVMTRCVEFVPNTDMYYQNLWSALQIQVEHETLLKHLWIKNCNYYIILKELGLICDKKRTNDEKRIKTLVTKNEHTEILTSPIAFSQIPQINAPEKRDISFTQSFVENSLEELIPPDTNPLPDFDAPMEDDYDFNEDVMLSFVEENVMMCDSPEVKLKAPSTDVPKCNIPSADKIDKEKLDVNLISCVKEPKVSCIPVLHAEIPGDSIITLMINNVRIVLKNLFSVTTIADLDECRAVLIQSKCFVERLRTLLTPFVVKYSSVPRATFDDCVMIIYHEALIRKTKYITVDLVQAQLHTMLRGQSDVLHDKHRDTINGLLEFLTLQGYISLLAGDIIEVPIDKILERLDNLKDK